MTRHHKSCHVSPKMSVQLWSVNDALQEDFEGTLTELAQMGFDGVELAGRFGPFADDPGSLKRCLNNLSLEVSGAHVAIETLDEENQEATVRFYQQLGVDLLIIPYDERAWHPQHVNHFIDDLNRLSTQLARHNMGIGFHNHDKEFGTYKNATYWDYIAENTHQQVALQQDVGWITYAGHNPTLYVNRYADRLPSIHFKACALENAAGHIPLIGQDSVDWAPLIATTTSLATVPWVVLEQEVYPCGLTSMQAVSASKQGLDELLSQVLAQ